MAALEAHRGRRPRRRDPTWPAAGSTSWRSSPRPPATVGTGHGRLRAGDDRRPERRRSPCSRRPWPTTRCAGRPLDAARTQLAYGEWLRRNQRRVDARQHLRHALETFQDLHAEALAARANQELRASGETARKRDPSTLVKLTPMELKVAQLVSSGPVEQGRRRPVLGLAADRGLPPAQRLRQGRRHLARRARPARARLTEPRPAHPGHLTGVSNAVRGHARQQCTPPTARARPS